MGLLVASYGGLRGILAGLTKSTDHPSRGLLGLIRASWEDLAPLR